MAKRVTLKQITEVTTPANERSKSPVKKKKDFIALNREKARAVTPRGKNIEEEPSVAHFEVTSVVEKVHARRFKANHDPRKDILDAMSKKRSGSHDKAIAEAKKKVYTVRGVKPSGRRLMNAKEKITYA